MLTNGKIFAQAIDQNPMNAGILREALANYVDQLNKIDPKADEYKDLWVNMELWVKWTNDLKNFIDKKYDENK